MIVWFNGELLPIEEAGVSPLDHGLVVGDGVFETLRVYDGQPFAWNRHLARLQQSAAGLGLDVPDVATLRAASDAVIARNGLREARLRITITGGPAPHEDARAGTHDAKRPIGPRGVDGHTGASAARTCALNHARPWHPRTAVRLSGCNLGPIPE